MRCDRTGRFLTENCARRGIYFFVVTFSFWKMWYLLNLILPNFLCRLLYASTDRPGQCDLPGPIFARRWRISCGVWEHLPTLLSSRLRFPWAEDYSVPLRTVVQAAGLRQAGCYAHHRRKIKHTGRENVESWVLIGSTFYDSEHQYSEHRKNELEEALLETRGCCAATCARVASCFVLMRSRICTSELGAGKRRKKAKRTTEQHDSIFLCTQHC